jgi:uncharacterized integral membrane protein
MGITNTNAKSKYFNLFVLFLCLLLLLCLRNFACLDVRN